MTDSNQPDKFRFTLIIRDVVTAVLKNAPDGWLETKITFTPDTFYKGLRRSLSVPYNFVKEGAYLLRKELYTYGVIAKVNLLIEKNVPETWAYKQLYSGRLDFSNAEDNQTGIKLDSITKDFTVQVDAYDEVKFLLPLEGDDVLDITLPPLALKESAEFIFLPSIDHRSDAYFGLQVVNNNQVATVNSVQNSGFYADSFPVWDNSNDNFFYRATTDTNVRLKGHLEGNLSCFNIPRNFQVNVYKSDGTLVKTLYQNNLPNPTAVPFSFDWDFVVNVLEGERLFFYFERIGSVVSTEGFQIGKGDLSLDYQTSSPASKCKGIRAYDVFQRLLKLMNTTSPTEPNLPVPNQSYLLDKRLNGVFKNLIYTCSDSIRAGNPGNTFVGTIYQPGNSLQAGGRYLVLGSYVMYNGRRYEINEVFSFKLGVDTFTSPDNNGFVKQISATPGLILSFKNDFFQDIFSLMGGQAAFGIDQGLAYLEDLNFCYRPGSGTLDVGVVDTSTKIVPALDLMYNAIKGGYKDQQYDAINGINEINSEVNYSTDLVKPARELNIRASSRADPYGIELARVKNVDTASSRSDNDNFMIVIKDIAEIDGSYKPVQMDALTSFAGVDSSYYNWFITPKQNLLRGGSYLRSIFDKLDGYSIKISSAEKSTSLITVDNSGRRVGEADNVVISAALGDKIFLPWYIQINAGLPLDASDILDMSPFSDIACTWNNVLIRGFSAETNVDEGQNSAQSFKLLLSPQNKTVDLIR